MRFFKKLSLKRRIMKEEVWYNNATRLRADLRCAYDIWAILKVNPMDGWELKNKISYYDSEIKKSEDRLNLLTEELRGL